MEPKADSGLSQRQARQQHTLHHHLHYTQQHHQLQSHYQQAGRQAGVDSIPTYTEETMKEEKRE